MKGIITLEDLQNMLIKYNNWKSRIVTEDGRQYLISSIATSKDQIIQIFFEIVDRFLICSTYHFLKKTDRTDFQKLLEMNDKLKFLKLYTSNDSKYVELSFEITTFNLSSKLINFYIDLMCINTEDILKDDLEKLGLKA